MSTELQGFSGSVSNRAIRLDGDVYFISEGDTIKIGWSGAPAVRIKALKPINGRPLEILAAFPGSAEDEKSAHRRFAHLRVDDGRGREWFLADNELLAFIAEVRASGRTLKAVLAGNSAPITADHVPTDAVKFGAWAETACVEWPSGLQVSAAKAWYGLRKSSSAEFDKFLIEYMSWLGRHEVQLPGLRAAA